jgi:hypothetical protein
VSAADAGDRLNWLWIGFFAATLGTGAVFGALSADGSAGFRLLPLLGAAALLALDRACGRLVPDPEALSRRQWAVVLTWYVGSLALLIPLVATYPPFGLAVYGFLPRVFIRLPLVAAVVAAALVVPALIVGQGGLSAAASAETWYASVGSGVLSVVIGVFIAAIVRQSDQRREALAALTAAQAEVAARGGGRGRRRGRLRPGRTGRPAGPGRRLRDRVAPAASPCARRVGACGERARARCHVGAAGARASG